MIKLWFLIALMSYPNIPSIHYKGFFAYETEQACMEKQVLFENIIADIEIQRERIFWVQTYCLEMHAFPSQIEEFKKQNQLENKEQPTRYES
tara:strand:- start:198 stop:473 length:276 start_codon:yes stop_codon:yes gene_type:complete